MDVNEGGNEVVVRGDWETVRWWGPEAGRLEMESTQSEFGMCQAKAGPCHAAAYRDQGPCP